MCRGEAAGRERMQEDGDKERRKEEKPRFGHCGKSRLGGRSLARGKREGGSEEDVRREDSCVCVCVCVRERERERERETEREREKETRSWALFFTTSFPALSLSLSLSLAWC